MNYLTIEMRNSSDIKLVVNEILTFRKENRGKWYQVNIITVIGTVRMKCFDKWIQVCDQPHFSTEHGLKVGEFKSMLIQGLTDYLRQ